MNHSQTIKFQTAEINLSDEYREARKLMGNKNTDLDDLYRTVSHIYVCIPPDAEEWAEAYLNLMYEIEQRQVMVMNLKIDALFR